MAFRPAPGPSIRTTAAGLRHTQAPEHTGYDAHNNLIATTLPDPDGAGPQISPVYIYVYDDVGQLLSVTDPLGNANAYQYDSLGRFVTTTYADPDGAGPQAAPVEAFAYDAVGNLTQFTDALGRATQYAYDNLYRHTGTTLPDPDGAGPLASPVYAFAYDAIGRLTTETDPLGNATTYAYDNLHRLTSIALADPDGAGPQTSPVYGYAYDAAGNLLSETDPLGRITAYEYDDLYRQTQVALPDPDGAGAQISPVYLYAYDALGRLISETDPLGNATGYAYDSLDRLIASTLSDPDGAGPLTSPVYSYAYDAVGNRLSETDPLGRITTFDYDNLNLQTKVTLSDPDGAGPQLSPFTLYAYDALGNLLSAQNALGETTTYAYDDLYRLLSETDPNGDAVTFGYDAVGNRTSLTDPELNTTTWVYDDLDRIIQETNELNDSRYLVYDAANNLIRKTDRNGRVTEFDHDNLHRTTAERWLDGGGATIRTLSYSFDAASQLIAASDPAAAYTYAYDNLGRRTSVTHDLAGLTFDVVLISSFNPAGDRTQLTALVNGTADFVNEYFYDALHRMTSVQQHGAAGGSTVAEKRVDFAYDAAGQWQTITRYADVAGFEHVATSSYAFDQAGRLTALTHAQGATTLADYDWTYDRANRITQFASLVDGTTNYNYDLRGQLTGADHSSQTDESYSYDDNGNRTNAGYSTGANNRLLSDGTYNYEYDAEGNRTKKTNIATGAVTEYTWDHRNRLVKITERAAAAGPATAVFDYVYNLFNCRIAKLLDTDGDGDHDSTTYYIHDGERYEEGHAGDDIVLAFDGDGELTHRYLHGPVVDQVFADEQIDELLGTTAPGEVLWPLTDNLNTVRDLVTYDAATDTTTVANHLTYDAFGNITAETAPSVIFAYAFTGRERDYESGLHYYRERYYATISGVFISEDPIYDDYANPWRYVGNSPGTATDPSGMQPPDAAMSAAPAGSSWTQPFRVDPRSGAYLQPPGAYDWIVGNAYHRLIAPAGRAVKGIVCEVYKRGRGAGDPVQAWKNMQEDLQTVRELPQTLERMGQMDTQERMDLAVEVGIQALITKKLGDVAASRLAKPTPRGVQQYSKPIGPEPAPTAVPDPIPSNPNEILGSDPGGMVSTPPSGWHCPDPGDLPQTTRPIEPYNRRKHYGNSPTKADRKALGAQPNEVLDHDPPLVQRYYDGDPNTGELPGMEMTDAERRASASDRSRMHRQPRDDSNAQGAEMQRYSIRKRRELGLD